MTQQWAVRLRLFLVIAFVASGFFVDPGLHEPVPMAQATSLMDEFSVQGVIASASTSLRGAFVGKIGDLGAKWAREEMTYQETLNFTELDDAINRLDVAGHSILGLLVYPGSGTSMSTWTNYVEAMVGRYGDRVDAWEIMNEADTYLSAADYVSYLSAAHDSIRALDGGATIVLSGITSRLEATNFLDGVASNGGWGKFNVVGLHVYHSGNPEKVNFGGGDVTAEMNRIVASIAKNGGGKKIWITETGYKSGSEGEENQANWLARELLMVRSVSSVEKIFTYRLYDQNDSYGLLTSSGGEKPSFGRVRDVASNIGGKGAGTQRFAQEQNVVHGFDSTDGWATKGSVNTSVTLTPQAGYKDTGLKISYQYSGDGGYMLMDRESDIDLGTPTAIGIWINGDNTKNTWKIRFRDSQGETFQIDLGSFTSGWHYSQFTFGADSAIVSWDGNGTIDYPIKFNAVVVDHVSGGESSGSGMVDSLTTVSGAADLYAYQFGSTLAYWRASGTADASLCGKSLSFSQAPSYTSVSSCEESTSSSTTAPAVETTVVEAPSGTSATPDTVVSTPKSSAKTAPVKVVVDAGQSTVRVDGEAVPANGTDFYRLVVTVKDKDGNILSGVEPSLAVGGGPVTVTGPTLVGSEWLWQLTTTEPGERSAVIKAGEVELKNLTITFAPPVIAEVEPVPVVETTSLPEEPETRVSPAVTVGAIGAGILLLGGLIVWLIRHRKFRQQS